MKKTKPTRGELTWRARAALRAFHVAQFGESGARQTEPTRINAKLRRMIGRRRNRRSRR